MKTWKDFTVWCTEHPDISYPWTLRVVNHSLIATNPQTGVRFEFLTTSSAPGPGGAA